MADPCGMVPPIYTDGGNPITRIGAQKTYVTYKDGVETIVLRPGFSGKIDEFGMLIPFPSVPAIRKVPDHIFPHVAAAIDPPEVVVDIRQHLWRTKNALAAGGIMAKKEMDMLADGKLRYHQVKVVKQEAVGMYEVAVIAAGSAEALKKWLDEHGYQYPKGMDKVCNEYVKASWCFVAVKTKVGQKDGVTPKPGQRNVNSKLPSGSTFDGFVQAMGFRFKTDKLVVPMRLSAFNAGKLRNIVYLLTDGPRKIKSIPEEYVVRQVTGTQLYSHVTQPLPLRVIGGNVSEIPEWQRKGLPTRRNPEPHNGAARDLFASDMLSIRDGKLSLPHEETEKALLAIGEDLGLRGAAVDKLNGAALAEQRKTIVNEALTEVKNMTLTVIDGDFPREVLAKQNLAFVNYRMPASRNASEQYDTKKSAPGGKKQGILKLGALEDTPSVKSNESKSMLADNRVVLSVLALALVLGAVFYRRRYVHK